VGGHRHAGDLINLLLFLQSRLKNKSKSKHFYNAFPIHDIKQSDTLLFIIALKCHHVAPRRLLIRHYWGTSASDQLMTLYWRTNINKNMQPTLYAVNSVGLEVHTEKAKHFVTSPQD
jgi:hypothetical protein